MLFQRLVNALKGNKTGQGMIMPGVMGEMLASMGLTEIGPHRYDQWRAPMPSNITFQTPYGPVCVDRKFAKTQLAYKERHRRGRFVGPFPTHGKKARLAAEAAA